MSRPPAESHAQITPLVVDAMVLAHGGLTWEHQFNDARFERLADVALSVTPSVSIKLKFAMMEPRPVLHGEMNGKVELMCQRCMGNMQYPIAESFDLMLIENEAELAVVPEAYEPWIANSLHLNVFELVEEQLLLALPLIAKHVDESDCVSIEAEAIASKPKKLAAISSFEPRPNGEVQRPFGNLRDLLNKQ